MPQASTAIRQVSHCSDGLSEVAPSRVTQMSRSLIERRLTELGGRLKELRKELAIVDEQLAHLAGDADDAQLKALVSETPLADHEAREAQRHADAMARQRAEVVATIARLEADQDNLLDRLFAEQS